MVLDVVPVEVVELVPVLVKVLLVDIVVVPLLVKEVEIDVVEVTCESKLRTATCLLRRNFYKILILILFETPKSGCGSNLIGTLLVPFWGSFYFFGGVHRGSEGDMTHNHVNSCNDLVSKLLNQGSVLLWVTSVQLVGIPSED